MNIGVSSGAYKGTHEDELDFQLNGPKFNDNNIIDPDTTPDIGTQDQNIVEPSESNPITGLTRVRITKPDSTMPLESSTEPTDALKSDRGSKPAFSFLGAGQALNKGIDSLITGLANFSKDPEGAILGAAEGLKNIVSLPGEVSQGKVPMMVTDPESGEQHVNPQAVEKAFDLANLMVLGPAPVASKMADGTLGSFMGVKSRTFDKNALGGAQILEKNGKSGNEIWGETGTYHGVDNKWRQEINDSTAKFNENWVEETPQLRARDVARKALKEDPLAQVPFDPDVGKARTKLPQVLDHPELYKAYPELEYVNIVYDPKVGGASWSYDKNTITVGKHFNTKSTILHEVQHAIQDLEGFAQGGAPGRAGLNYELKLTEAMQDSGIVEEVQSLSKKATEGLTPMEEARLKNQIYILGKFNEYAAAGNQEAIQNYYRLAGETEARNTQQRMLMNKQERRELYPDRTMDEPRSNQVVVDKPAMTSAYGVIDPRTGKIIK